MDQFDLTCRPIFDVEGGRLTRQPSSEKIKRWQVSLQVPPFPCAGHALAWTGAALDGLQTPLPPGPFCSPPAALPLSEFRRRIDATLVRASCRCCARQALKPVALRADPPRRSDGASCLVGQNLDWLAATPIPPRPPRSPPTDLDRASDLRGPVALLLCEPSPPHRPASVLPHCLTVPPRSPSHCGGPARRPVAAVAQRADRLRS